MTTLGIIIGGDDEFTTSVAVSGAVSVRIYQIMSPVLEGIATVQGSIRIRVPGPKDIRPLAGQVRVLGNLSAGITTPTGAFKDFTHYPFGGVDPVMARIGITGTGLSGATGSYTRQYSAFVAPQDYPVSGGAYAWKRAAYASVGFKFAGMTINKHQILDAVQLETLPLAGTGPSAYSTPRSLQVVVKPSRLNYATNPNMEAGTTGYGNINGATVGSDSSLPWTGTKSIKITSPANNTVDGGITFNISGLIPGRTYTMSAKTTIAVGCGEVSPASSFGTVQEAQVTYAAAPVDPRNPRWRTPSVTFTATASTAVLTITVPHATMTPSVASLFWVDGMLIEEGTSPGSYFDGSMGNDYLWEVGGTVNLTRSYFYENRIERGFLVQTLLNENTPLGITSAVPQYAVLPTQ